MDLMTRRRALIGHAETPDIPSIYEPLKRLISDGHQCINTQYYPLFKQEDVFSLAFSCGSLSGTQILFAAGSGSAGTQPQLPLVNSSLRGDFITFGSFGTPTVNQKIEFKYENNKCSCNGRSGTIKSALQNVSGRILCVMGKISENNTLATMSFYGMTYSTSGELALDMVPVLRSYDEKPGTYDKARRLFIVNAITTSEFGYEKMDGTIVSPIST